MKTLRILTVLIGVAVADLPSCSRARCNHCDVEFIAKMCQKTCSACPTMGGKYKTYRENRQSLLTHTEEKKQLYKESKAQKPQITQPDKVSPGQQGLPMQLQQQVPASQLPMQPPYRNVQLAAPQAQAAPTQYSPTPTNVATLAPLIPAPRPTDINRNLAQQPADLAQPLPEYLSQNQNQASFSLAQPTPQLAQRPPQFPQLPTQVGPGAVQPQYYNTNQNAFQQPVLTDLFGRPLYQGQPGQAPLQYPQQQQSTPILNPFLPFAQQTGATGTQSSFLDPFGLFNLPGMPNHAQGTALSAVAVTPIPFHQAQTGLGVPTLATPQAVQQPPPTLQQIPQPNYYGQQQQFAYNQQPNASNQQNMQQYIGQQQQGVGQSVVPGQATQNYYGPQYNSNNQQPARPYQQISAPNQQPTPLYRSTQPQIVQVQIQGTQPLALPPTASSMDSSPINYQKYEVGKGPAPHPLPQQCPRQPGWAPCITKQQANERFMNCCSRLGEGCMPLCNYDAPLATMQLAVLTGRCPLNKMADIMVCASGYEDATACCEAYNVFEPGYEQCRPYCNPAAGLPQGGLLSEKYKCLAKLSHIQQCFYVSQKP